MPFEHPRKGSNVARPAQVSLVMGSGSSKIEEKPRKIDFQRLFPPKPTQPVTAGQRRASKTEKGKKARLCLEKYLHAGMTTYTQLTSQETLAEATKQDAWCRKAGAIGLHLIRAACLEPCHSTRLGTAQEG